MAEHECVQEKRINRIEEKVDKLIDNNAKQDVLMTKLDVTLNQVNKSYEENKIVMQKVSDNLDKLNQKSDRTDTKVVQIESKLDGLAKDFQNAEEKNIIKVDQRIWIKNVLTKIVLPFGSGGFIIYEVLKLFGVFD